MLYRLMHRMMHPRLQVKENSKGYEENMTFSDSTCLMKVERRGKCWGVEVSISEIGRATRNEGVL